MSPYERHVYPPRVPDAALRPAAETFEPWLDAVSAAAKDEPLLGLAGTEGSARHLKRAYGAQLIAAGAVVRTRSGQWLARRDSFRPVLRALMLGLPLGEEVGSDASESA